MEADKEKIKIKELADEIFIVSLFAHMRILFKEAGEGYDGGAILFIPDKNKEESVIQSFELCGGVRGEIHGSKIPVFPNYKVGLVTYQPFYKEEAIRKYISCDKYFPVMIVCGIVPEKLLFCRNIITLENVDDDFERARERATLFNRITEYLHGNGKFVIDNIQSLTKKYKKTEEEDRLHRVLYFSSIICCSYLADNAIEREDGQEILCHMETMNHKMLSAVEIGNDGTSILLMVKRALVKYVDERKDVRFGHIEKAEGDLMTSLDNGKAILYDDNFYYIGESMFRKTIESYQQVISYLSVKQELYRAEILSCDGVEGNYTTKATVVNTYGMVRRLRFLKLRKERIDDGGELTLAERGDKNVSGEI